MTPLLRSGLCRVANPVVIGPAARALRPAPRLAITGYFDNAADKPVSAPPSRSSRLCSSSSASAARMPIVSAAADPLRSAMTARRRTASLSSLVDELVQQRPHAVHDARDGRGRAARARGAPSRGRPGSRPRARAAVARSSARKRNCADRAVGDGALAEVLRRAAASTSSSHCARSYGELPLGPARRARRLRRGLGERHARPASVRAGPMYGPTAGSGARCAAARRCAPTSPATRAQPNIAGVTSRRDRRDLEHDGGPELDVRLERPVGMTSRAAPRAPPARAPRRPRRAASRARSPCGEDPRARVLGAVDAVAEAHDPLAAREQLAGRTLGVAGWPRPRRASSARASGRRRAAGPRARRRADDSAAAQSAPVEAAIRAVKVEAFMPCSAAETQ